jgi:hypothetical protein
MIEMLKDTLRASPVHTMRTGCGVVPKITIDVCWLSGYSPEEIAEILGVSVEEVRSHIRIRAQDLARLG